MNGRAQRTDLAPLSKENAVPFRYPQGGFWNADLSRETQTFGYVYNDALGSAQAVKDRFAGLYTWATRQRPGGPVLSPPESMRPLDVQSAQVFQFGVAQAARSTARMAVRETPQVAMGALKTLTTAVSETAGFDKPVANKPSSVTVSTDPVAPGTETSEVAFVNPGPTEQATGAPSSIDMSAYDRDWYVDNVVER